MLYETPPHQKGGVYEVHCSGNDKSYVGSTVNMEQRWKQHLSEARRNKHHSRYFQNSWNKYGEDTFTFRVICYTDNIELARKIEKKIIIEKNLWQDGFNEGGVGGGSVPSKEYILCDPNGNLHETNDLKKFAEDRGMSYTDLVRVASGKKLYYKNWTINHKEDGEPEMWNPKIVEYIVTFPDGHEEVVTNLAKFCREHGLYEGNAYRIVSGEREHYKQYRFRRL